MFFPSTPNFCWWWWWVSSMFRWLKRRLLSSNLASKCQQGQVVLVATKIICSSFFFSTLLGIEHEETLLSESAARETSLNTQIIEVLNSSSLKDGWRYQNGWIFGKFLRGEGSSWIQKFTLQILDLQTGLLNILFRKRNCNTIFRKWGAVKGRLELFLKFIRFCIVVSHQSSITWSSMCRSSWSTS